ncbi:hypothetical protein FS837_003489 [Tulasnella sp. UAMH 9824]|nr:hypothetical protein FS837_003489 [Tulasnella sp. UAMH 9824]
MSASVKSDPETAPNNGVDQDAAQLQLNRSWHFIESFAASFCALNFIGGVRSVFFLGLLAGGPAAMWSSYIITMFFMFITAAVLAEICSALPLSGSIYIWAAESAGPKYARFVGVVVAWWTCTAWMTFSASNCQTTANYIVSLLAVYEIDFPGGITMDNVKWRAFIWAISEGLLIVSVAMNYLPSRWYSRVFKFSLGLMMLDFFLCVIWLPIANTSIAIVAASRLIFAVARDGVLPLSWWIGRVSRDGQPRNAVTVMYVFGSALLCVILASNVAFTSLVSAGGIPTIAAYGLIGLLRLTMTPNSFRSTKFRLGVFRRPMYAATAFFQAIVFSVMVSPFFFPVTAQSFNFAGVILGAVTIFAIIMYFVTPEDKWLRPETVRQALAAGDLTSSESASIAKPDHE